MAQGADMNFELVPFHVQLVNELPGAESSCTFLGAAAVVMFAFEQGELSCHSVVAAYCRDLLSDFGLA